MRSIHPIMHRWQDIVAILPQYNAQDRDITRFYFNDNTYCDFSRPLQTALNEICRYLNVNLKTLYNQSAACLNGRTRRVPLSLVRHFCLIPITTRTVRYTSHHASQGYIVAQKVRDIVREGERHCTITFYNSSTFFTVPQSKRTVEHQLELASQLIGLLRHY